MKNLDGIYKKCYILNTVFGVCALAITLPMYRKFLKAIEKEHQKTQETIRDNIW